MIGTRPTLVSVIVPIFNVADHLDQCVTSLLGQTYDDLEIVLVDDGSTDASAAMCDTYASKDSRVRVVHRTNGGLSIARNTGLDVATGQYISFVDGDDYLGERHIENLMRCFDNLDVDVAIGSLRRVGQRPDETPPNERLEHFHITGSTSALKELFYQRVSNSACAKIYRRHLFDHIRYPAGKLYEDLATTYRVLAWASRVAISADTSYFYVQRAGSIMHSTQLAQRLQAITFAREAVAFVRREHPQLVQAATTRLFMESVAIARDAPATRSIKAEAPEVAQVLSCARNLVVRDAGASKIARLYALMSWLGPPGVRALGRLHLLAKDLLSRTNKGMD